MPVQHKPDDVTTVVTALRKKLELDELRPKQAGGSPVEDAAPAEDDEETPASGVKKKTVPFQMETQLPMHRKKILTRKHISQ